MNKVPEFALNSIAQASHKVCVSLTPARYIVVDEFAVDLDAKNIKPCDPGTLISDLTSKVAGPIVCSVNGEFISRSNWGTTLQPGEVLVIQQIPQGGGGGSNLRTVLQLVVMVVAMVVPGMQGLAGWQAAAMSAAINAVGMLAINALIPLPKANNGQQSGESASPTYNVQLGGNSARIDASIPVGYGQCFQKPDFAAQPYQTFVNDEQIYHAILCIGRGKYNILRTMIDDTDIRNFDDVQLAYVGPGQEFATLANQNLVETGMVSVPEVAAQEFKNPGEFVGPFNVTKPGYPVNQLSVDFVFQQGLGNVKDDGGISSRSVDFVVQARSIDEYDRPTNGWRVLDRFTETAATTKPKQITKTYDVPPARYQLRVARIDAYSDNNRHLNRVVWAGARGRLVKGITVDPQNTYLVLKIRASDQMSSMSQRQIGVEWQRHIPVYRDGQWHLEHSRNPLWATYDVLYNQDYGMKIDRSRIDLEAFARLSAVAEARQDRFDYIVDTQGTALESANLAARAARATMFMRAGVFTVVRDTKQSLPVAQFTPHNLKKDSFKADYTLPTEFGADAIRVAFKDGILNDERVVIAQLVGTEVIGYQQGMRPANAPVPERYAEFKLQGVVGRTHALREALYLAASSFWRRTSVSFTTTAAGLLPSYGSLVEVVHDLMDWGQSAEVISYDPFSLTMSLSAPLQWSAGDQHFIRVGTRAGSVTEPVSVTRGSFDDEVVLAQPLGFLPVTDDRAEDSHLSRTRISFGNSSLQSRMVRVKEIKPKSDGSVDIRGVEEDNRVHSVDAHLLPAPGEIQDPLNNGYFDPSDAVYENPALSGLYNNRPASIVLAEPSLESSKFTFKPDGTWAVEINEPEYGPPGDDWGENDPLPITGSTPRKIGLGTWGSKTIDPELVGVDLEYRVGQIHLTAANHWRFEGWSPDWTTFSNDFTVIQTGYMNSYGGDTDMPFWQKTEIYVQIRRRDTFTLVFDSKVQSNVINRSNIA